MKNTTPNIEFNTNDAIAEPFWKWMEDFSEIQKPFIVTEQNRLLKSVIFFVLYTLLQ